LQASAVIGYTTDLVEHLVDEFFSNGVMTTSIVVGCILFSSDHLLGVEQVAVGAGTDFIDNVGFEVGVDGSGDIFAIAL
jgi:hypothetical protein